MNIPILSFFEQYYHLISTWYPPSAENLMSPAKRNISVQKYMKKLIKFIISPSLFSLLQKIYPLINRSFDQQTPQPNLSLYLFLQIIAQKNHKK